ncbi:unnamed protein product [Symbiodinium microadriaticum]|nr:unnamed protein product [Symbiodinium microadriaticum]
MWTNDDSGFPLPRGCYYGPLYTDVVANEPARPSYREYFIIFEPKAGLKDVCTINDQFGTRSTPCVYQLAFNARVGEIGMVNPREVVGIYTQCAGKSGSATVCGPRYSVLEYGPAYATASTMLPEENHTQLDRVEMLPWPQARLLSSLGLRALSKEAAEEVLELQPTLTVEEGGAVEELLQFGIRAWPKDPAWPIERSGQLHLFFRPFTLWDLSGIAFCQANCVPIAGISCSDGRGRESAGCQVRPIVRTPFESVVPMQRNTLTLEYPAQMEAIPEERGDEAHLLNVSELRLPPDGFFTLQMLAEYLDSNGLNPSSAFVSPSMRRIPVSGTTTGRIVVDGQTGNGPRPFAFERQNVLIVRLMIGVTLRSPAEDEPVDTEPELNDLDDNLTEGSSVRTVPRPMVQILLPPDYTCSVIGNGTADPDGTLDMFLRDLNDDGYVDNPMGTVLSGTWSDEGPVCSFTLEKWAAVFARQIFYVRLSVNNPRQALMRTDPTNVWQIKLSGANATLLGGLVNFISLAEEVNLPGWVGNLAVLTPLEGESLQPSNLSAGATNELSVFFQVIHAMPRFSHILLDAPDGFDFTDNCSVGPLEDAYYADWDGLPWGETVLGPRALTSSLGLDVNCTTDNWKRSVLSPPATTNFTRAVLRIGRTLISNKYYAFKVRIINSVQWDASHHDDWRIWVQSPEGYMVDGSKYTIQFNSARIDTLPQSYWDKSWGVYQDPMRLPLSMDFGQSLLLPTSVFDMSTLMTVYPLTPSSDGQLINVRMLAPVGYVWVPHVTEGWRGYVPNVTCEFCELIVTPQVRLFNELILPDLVMRLGHLYGFQVRVRVPERPPTRSLNAFYLEMGFDPGDFNLDRMQASMLLPPPLRVVSQARVDSLCNLAGYADNIVEFHVHIASPLEVNSGFLFAGDERTRGTLLRCWPEILIGPILDATNGLCSVTENIVTALPEILLYVIRGTSPAGMRVFRFRRSRNPLQPTSQGGTWNFGTYADLHMYPKHKVLDLGKDIPVPRILAPLLDSGLLQPPVYEAPGYGRDDGPLRINLLTFFFKVQEHPEVPESIPYLYIALRGPAGFSFEEDCFPNLVALSPNLGSRQFPCSAAQFPAQMWCPGIIEPWPENLEPVACLGILSSARISVPNPLVLQTAAPVGAPVPAFVDNSMYAFKIQVQNPEFQVESGSQWALDFVYEAGVPFDSLPVATFDHEETMLHLASALHVQPLFQTVDQQYMAFRLDFKPYTLVPGPRMLRSRRLQPLGGGVAPLEPDAEEGSIALLAPAGFQFRAGDFDLCIEISVERKDRVLWDTTGIFGSSDATCFITGDSLDNLTYTLINAKAFEPLRSYSLKSVVKNIDVSTWPDSNVWLLESFKRFVATGQLIRLDSFNVPGTPTIAPSPEFMVMNTAQEFTAGVRTPHINVSMVFNSVLRNGDVIIVTPPPGFDLLSEDGGCRDFQWIGTFRPLVLSPPPACNCTMTPLQCKLELNVMESSQFRGLALGEQVRIAFEMSVTNPVMTPDIVEDYWRMELWHGTSPPYPFSGGLAESWPVYGTLDNLTVSLVGFERRAGAMSDLRFDFVPSVWGTALDIVVHEPTGFQFQNARVNAPWIRHELTTGSRLVLIGGTLVPGQMSQLTLSLVRLGDGGGPTRISIRVFADSQLTRETARRLNFLQGFRLPGAVVAENLRLWSETVVDHWSGEQADSVSPLLPCHTNTLARFEIFIRLSNVILHGDALIITNSVPFGEAPWEPSTEAEYESTLEMCLGPGQHGGIAENGTWICDRVQEVNITSRMVIRNSVGIVIGMRLTFGAMRPEYVLSQASLDEVRNRLKLEGDLEFRELALEANRDYRLRIWLRASPAQTMWSILTEDALGFLSNTNDGLTPGSVAVPEMTLTVTSSVTRVPPESAVYVRVHVRTGPSQGPFSKLQLLLPYGFAPHGASAAPSSRLIVGLNLEQGEGVLDQVTGMMFNLRIMTPATNVPDLRWFVLAKEVIVDDITGITVEPINGWADAGGFGVAPCPVSLMYGAIPSATGWLSISFYVPAMVAGKFVLITAPDTFLVQCPKVEETGLELACEDFRVREALPLFLQSLQRTVNVTLVGGTSEGDNVLYMFLLNVLTPAEPNIFDVWQIRVLDDGFAVVDAALAVQQPRFVLDLEMGNPSLSWLQPPQMGEVSNVQVEVSFLRRVKDVKAILVSLPENYRHDIQHKNQLRNVNKQFPLTIDTEWRVFDNLRYIKVLVEVAETGEAQIIIAGTYQWQFPVMVPLIKPFTSEWYVSLCAEQTCTEVQDPGIMASFPVPNNEPQLPAKVFQVVSTTGAGCHNHFSWMVMGMLLFAATS